MAPTAGPENGTGGRGEQQTVEQEEAGGAVIEVYTAAPQPGSYRLFSFIHPIFMFHPINMLYPLSLIFVVCRC